MSDLFSLDAGQRELLATVHSLSSTTLAAHAAAVDAEARFPEESIAALRDAGLLGLTLATAVGGRGQPPRVFAAVVEELARADASTAMIYVMHVAASNVIAASTTLAGKEALLGEIAAGRHLTTLAFSERGSRANFWAPVSQLAPAGDGFTTTAFKSWVTSAGHADSYVSAAQIPGAKSPVETALYLVRKGQKGAQIAGRFDGLGLRGNDSAPVVLEGLGVARGDLVTPLGEGIGGMLQVVLPWFGVGTAAMAIGLAGAAVAATGAHLAGTTLEHAGMQLRDLPQLRARIAEMHVRTAAARALLAATTIEMEAPTEMTPLAVLSTRAAALETALHVTDLAMRACGGAAFSRQLPVERLFRDARAGWVMAPTVDQLYDFIGKALTGLPLL
jgi:alkylation response protein AidB-like acyl-CoA dehydrogenase